MSGQGMPEEGADCSASLTVGLEVCCVLDGCVCLHCLYGPRLQDSMYRDSQGAGLGPGNGHNYAKCPLCLSVACNDGYCI